MSNLYQLYAFVTAMGWDESLSERWPDAPLISNYRLLVFTNKELPKLKIEYGQSNFQSLGVTGTILAMEAGEVGPFLCTLGSVQSIKKHFILEEIDNEKSN